MVLQSISWKHQQTSSSQRNHHSRSSTLLAVQDLPAPQHLLCMPWKQQQQQVQHHKATQIQTQASSCKACGTT